MSRSPLRSAHLAALLAALAAVPAVSPAPVSAAEVLLNGYYRSRFRVYDNLFLQRDVEGDVANREPGSDETTFYFDHRLRLEPEIRVNPYLSVYVQADVMDNRVFGTDPVASSYSDLYTNSLGTSQTLGLPASYDMNLAVKRAWAEIYAPFGRFKVGRTANVTGMGLHFNDGNGWDADGGDTVDRVQFLTRLGPVYGLVGFDQIYEGLQDHPNDGQALVGAVAYRSELASASLYTYWQRDRSYPTLPGATISTTEAGGNVFSDALRNDMVIGTWDLWAKTQLGPVQVETEGVLRYGKGDLALLPAGAESADQAVSLSDVTLLQGGWVIRGSYARTIDTYGVEFGLASGDEQDGDEDTTDRKNTTFTFDPDYRVSLLMFRVPMPLAASTYNESGLTAGGNEPVTGYGVSNAIYLRPTASFKVYQGLTADVAGLVGWSYTPNPATNNEKLYGYELMGGLRYHLWDRMDLRLRGAVMLPGAAFADTERDILHNQPALAGEVQAFITF